MIDQSLPVRDAEDRFILLWGEMAQVWGINKTMGQVHALLFVTKREWSAEEVMDRLQISRGNVSVTLRGLIDWSLIRRFHKPGERREFFVAVSDVTQIFRTILTERKKREFDPVFREVERLVTGVEPTPEGVEFQERLADLRDLLRALDQAFSFFSGGDVAGAADLLKVELPNLG